MTQVRDKSMASHIEDYGIIGDMRTCALVGLDGSIDFLCWPEFDSPTIFARILDTDLGRGGHWSIHPEGGTIRKQNYVSASNILQTKWICEDGLVTLTDFFAIRKEKNESIKPPRRPILIRKLDCMRGQMKIKVEICPRPDYSRGDTKVEAIKTDKIGKTYTQRITWSGPAIQARENSIDEDIVRPPIISVVYLPGDEEVVDRTTDMFHTFSTDNKQHGHAEGVVAEFMLHEGQQVFMEMADDGSASTVDTLAKESMRREREVTEFWRDWIHKCTYRGRMQQEVERSLLVLKLLTYKPTGAIIAAPTFSLPEKIHSSRNWDYRYSWVRDSSFTVYVFLKMGYAEEAERYMNFIFARIKKWQDTTNPQEKDHLPLMFSIHGDTLLPEETLDHFGGYKDSLPVRIGNAATTHVQLDIYGELMDAIYLYNKHGKPISYDQWVSIRRLTELVCRVWKDPDNSIWEVRGKQENYVYSKIMLWVAIDRSLRLAEKRNLPCPKRYEWLQKRDEIYEDVMERGYNPQLKSFIQSYENNEVLDAAVLIAPLVFFMPANDPRFTGTLDQIIKPLHKGGLTSAGLVYRYDPSKVDDGVGGGTEEGGEGTFVMCTLWLIEALTRAGEYDKKYLELATRMFENVTSFSNDLGLFSEEIAISGEQLGNTPQAFSHLAFISSAFNLERVMHET